VLLQSRPGLRKLADRGSQADDTSCLRRLDGRVGEVEFRLVALRFGRLELLNRKIGARRIGNNFLWNQWVSKLINQDKQADSRLISNVHHHRFWLP
jgi:hypothetical protein